VKQEGIDVILALDASTSMLARDESPEVVAVSSTITFDKGLSTEYRQTFDCRVRVANGKASDVIGLQFNWSKDDLKKANAGG